MTFTLPQAVIFDWDNTLVGSWGAIDFAINKTFEHFGKPRWTPEQVRLNCRRSARDTFPEWFGIERWKEAYELFYEHFNAIRAEGATPTSGAVDLLRWLKKADIACFVVSNKRGPDLRKEVVTLRWGDFFVKLVGSGDAAQDKPARDPIDLALLAANLTPGPDIWFVGDTDVDVVCARNADCTPVFVGDQAEAAKLSVEMAFDDCLKLYQWLEAN